MYDVINMPDLIDRYFSSKLWLGLFVTSIVYLFFRVQAKQKRAFLLTVVAFFIVINAVVIKLFTKLDENSTFYRHLWAVPTAVIIGIAVVDLIKTLPRWYIKIPVVFAFAIFLWFANKEYIRCRNQVFSTDAKMVPEEVIELEEGFETLRDLSGKRTLFVVCPVIYERSYGNMPVELNLYTGFLRVLDSSFLSDYNHNGEAELTGEKPDVKHIMSTSCSNGIDYVIVSKIAEQEFYTNGYEPALICEDFVVYKCEGYEGYKLDLNSLGLISWMSWYDAKGIPCNNLKGYSYVEYSYDRRSRMISEQYKDKKGNLINSVEGFARCEREYTSFDKIKEERVFDEFGNACLRANRGYSIVRNEWNEKKQLVKTSYFDENGELACYSNRYPWASVQFTYDAYGNVIGEKHFDKEGNPQKALIAGYDEIRREYDQDHHMILEMFCCNGQLFDRKDLGYAEEEISYDSTGRIIRVSFYNSDGELTNRIDTGYAIREAKFDDDGALSEYLYFDKDGETVSILIE